LARADGIATNAVSASTKNAASLLTVTMHETDAGMGAVRAGLRAYSATGSSFHEQEFVNERGISTIRIVSDIREWAMEGMAMAPVSEDWNGGIASLPDALSYAIGDIDIMDDE